MLSTSPMREINTELQKQCLWLCFIAQFDSLWLCNRCVRHLDYKYLVAYHGRIGNPYATTSALLWIHIHLAPTFTLDSLPGSRIPDGTQVDVLMNP